MSSKSFDHLVGGELNSVLDSDGASLLRLQLKPPLYVVLGVELGIKGRSILSLLPNHRLCQCHLSNDIILLN